MSMQLEPDTILFPGYFKNKQTQKPKQKNNETI